MTKMSQNVTDRSEVWESGQNVTFSWNLVIFVKKVSENLMGFEHSGHHCTDRHRKPGNQWFLAENSGFFSWKQWFLADRTRYSGDSLQIGWQDPLQWGFTADLQWEPGPGPVPRCTTGVRTVSPYPIPRVPPPPPPPTTWHPVAAWTPVARFARLLLDTVRDRKYHF